MIKKKIGITLILSILLALLTTGMAFASEGDEFEFEGTVISVDFDQFLIEVQVDNAGVLETYFVQVGENYDLYSLVEGELIEVKGIINEVGILVMTELKIQDREQEREQEQEGQVQSYFCTNESAFHPLGLKIATTYGVEYSAIEGYMCGENHVPIGQIKLAVQTAALATELGDEVVLYTDFLDGFEGISWGQIWQELGLKGKPDHGVPFGQLKKGDGETADADAVTPPGQAKKSGDENGFSEKDYQTASQIGNKYGFSQEIVLAYHKDSCGEDWTCTRAHFRVLAGSTKETGKPDKKDKPNK